MQFVQFYLLKTVKFGKECIAFCQDLQRSHTFFKKSGIESFSVVTSQELTTTPTPLSTNSPSGNEMMRPVIQAANMEGYFV